MTADGGGEVAVTTRVGLSKGADLLSRYVVAASPWASGGPVPAPPGIGDPTG